MIFQNVKTPFQAIKTRISKSRKIDIFPTFFFYALQTRKMYAVICQNEKMPFQATKKRCSKSREIDIFPKGLTDGLGPQMAIFSTVFFYAIYRRKTYSMIFYNEKTLFQAIETRSSKSRKIDIFPRGLTHGFGPKMVIFTTFFLTHYRPGKCIL